MVVVSKRLGSNDTIESVLNRKPRLILEGRGNSSMTEVEIKSARRRNRTISNEIKAKQIQESEIGIVQRISLDVIVDGIDGSGKTTLNANLYSVLAREGIHVTIVNESEADPFREGRDNYRKFGVPNPRVLLLNKIAGRRAVILNTREELTEPGIRLYERGYGTTLAEYLTSTARNGHSSSNQRFEEIRRLITVIEGTYLVPDLHIILDVDPEKAAERIAERYISQAKTPEASEGAQALRRKREYFLAIAKFLPNATYIDTTELGKEEVCERTLKAIRGSTKYAMLKNR